MVKYKILTGREKNVIGLASSPMAMSSSEKEAREEAIREVRGDVKKKTSKSKGFSGKLLKKPKKISIKKASAIKKMRDLADNTGPLVREVEQREVVKDDRNLFFDDEMDYERRKMGKWLR